MKSIGIIIPYFGRKPVLYDAWEQTALYNETVDFYIFTDILEIKEKRNIHVIYQTFSECRKMIQEAIDVDICLDEPYKLCDYRPTYGLAFSQWIGSYDFWGYCDLDVLLGNLRAFFTDKILDKVERCLANGHISLWKNTERMNNLFCFQEVGYGINYQEAYTSPDSFYFDEQRGVYTKCLLNDVIFSPYVAMRDPLTTEKKFYNRLVDDKNQFIIVWEKGRLFAVTRYKREEICYAHFFRREFLVDRIESKIELMKVVPGHVFYNEPDEKKDFEYAEIGNYKLKIIFNSLWKSVRRYGAIKTIQRQLWSKKSNIYIRKILKEKGEIIEEA